MVSSVRGRAEQMNKGADIAKGKILIFLHADTILPNNALDKINKIINNKEYKAGAFNLGIDSKKKIYKMIGFISSIRSRITRVPYGDQAYFINRNYFFYIGKFKKIPIMEDVELMNRIKRAKEKIYILKEKVRTSARRWEREGVIRCTLRNWALIMLYNIGFKPEKLASFYK
jgi:rSAM/selenodomain-associated transferase 2